MPVLTLARLAAMIDQTLLKPEASAAEREALCAEAVYYGFKAVCVNPWYLSYLPRAGSGAAFVKTSTGFAKGGATAVDVALLRRTVAADVARGGRPVGGKASGGIRPLDDVLCLIAAGAQRIETSAGVALMKNLEET